MVKITPANIFGYGLLVIIVVILIGVLGNAYYNPYQESWECIEWEKCETVMNWKNSPACNNKQMVLYACDIGDIECYKKQHEFYANESCLESVTCCNVPWCDTEPNCTKWIKIREMKG